MRVFQKYTLPPQILEIWRWWLDEMAGMLPARWRAADRGPFAIVSLDSDSVCVELFDGEHAERHVNSLPLEAFDDAAWAELASLLAVTSTELRLGSPDVFIAPLILPEAARSRLAAAVELQIDQISPVEAINLTWVAKIVTRSEKRIAIDIAMVRKARLEAVIELFAVRRICISTIAAVSQNGPIAIYQAPAAIATLEERRDRWSYLSAIFLIAAIPVWILLGSWSLDYREQNHIKKLSVMAGYRIAENRDWRQRDELRRMLNQVYHRPAISDILEYLARTLPSTVALNSLEVGANRELNIVMTANEASQARRAMDKADMFKEVMLIDEQPSADGRMTMHFRAAIK